ncbi:MAG: murein biosynthesis integral membrane protein MurJ [Clostridiaceae bacterium]|nr:murein biosynthesis integral membrane protein MurJ [Clostridiaceae bacterium]
MSQPSDMIRPVTITPPDEKKRMTRSTATVLMMIGLLLSKLTGQLREILIVPIFGGLGVESDAFIIGFQIPDLFYQLLVGGAIQAAITPTLARAIERKREKAGWRSISIFINTAAVVMVLAVVLGELLAPLLIKTYNVGKNPQTIALAIRVTRALFPQVFFMMLAALCIGILNAYKKFGSTSFGPSIYNTCVVLSMVILGQATVNGPIRVAFGVMISALVFFLIQFFLARKEFRQYVFSLDIHDSGFRKLLRLAIPTLISGSIIQLNSIILTRFATQFDGAATALRQATTTWQLPYGVIVVAIGNVMLPSLAAACASKSQKQARTIYTQSLRSALFLIFPAAAIFLVMQADTIRAIFQWSSHYSEQAVVATAAILRWYCIAMVAQSVVFITNHAFYARRITHIALYNGILSLLLNTIFCYFLTKNEALSVSALSLSYMLTSLISAFLLYTLYRKGFKNAAPRRIWPFIIRLLLCTSVLMIAILLLAQLPISPAGKFWQLAWYGGRALLGFAAYLTIAWMIGLHESKMVQEKIRQLAGRLSVLIKSIKK